MARIMIVEDEEILRDGLSILLKANSYQVDEAENGQVALELTIKNTYDLILLDLMMPVLDGIGFLQKADLKTRAPETRVVVLSNLSPADIPDVLPGLGVSRQEIKANMSTRQMIEMVRGELSKTSS